METAEHGYAGRMIRRVGTVLIAGAGVFSLVLLLLDAVKWPAWYALLIASAALASVAAPVWLLWGEHGVYRQRRRKALASLVMPLVGSRHEVEVLTIPKGRRSVFARALVSVGDGEMVARCRGFSEASAAERARQWCTRNLDLDHVVIRTHRLDETTFT